MRVVGSIVVALALALTLGCGGKKRHIVIHPDEVPGRRGDGWRVTSEPAGAPRPDGQAAAPQPDEPAAPAQ